MKQIFLADTDESGKVIFGENGQPQGKYVEFSNSELSRLQVVPELAAMVLGYKNQDMIRDFLFSSFPAVDKENGKLPVAGREGQTQQAVDRALRGKVNHMSFKSGSLEYTLAEASLGFMIDDREKDSWAITPEQLMTVRQNAVNEAIDVYQELQVATLATTSTNYPSATSGAAKKWATTGDPVYDTLTEREVVRKNIGKYPNVAIFDPTAWKLFRTNEAVRSYASKFVVGGGKPVATVISEQLAAQILEVENVYVGKSIYVSTGTGAAGSANTTSDIWSTVQSGNLVLAYTGSGMLEPTYGLKVVKKGYPKTESYRLQANKSDVYETSHIYQYLPALVDSNSDFLAGQLIYSIA